jgi:hypothetical protein
MMLPTVFAGFPVDKVLQSSVARFRECPTVARSFALSDIWDNEADDFGVLSDVENGLRAGKIPMWVCDVHDR